MKSFFEWIVRTFYSGLTKIELIEAYPDIRQHITYVLIAVVVVVTILIFWRTLLVSTYRGVTFGVVVTFLLGIFAPLLLSVTFVLSSKTEYRHWVNDLNSRVVDDKSRSVIKIDVDTSMNVMISDVNELTELHSLDSTREYDVTYPVLSEPVEILVQSGTAKEIYQLSEVKAKKVNGLPDDVKEIKDYYRKHAVLVVTKIELIPQKFKTIRADKSLGTKETTHDMSEYYRAELTLEYQLDEKKFEEFLSQLDADTQKLKNQKTSD